jgi:hypothetical protein
MASGEDETQKVVTNIVVESRFEIRHSHLFLLHLAAEFFVLALKQLVAAEVIDGAMFGRSHEPGARIVRDTCLGPLLERSDESVLCEVLGKAQVARDSRETSDEPG